jgi:hypothetical protein
MEATARLDRNQIGKSWHSAEQSGLWNGLCARQNGDDIAKKEKLRKSGNQTSVIWRMSVLWSALFLGALTQFTK